MKKSLTKILAALLSLALLCGCSSHSDLPDNETVDPPASSAEDTAPPENTSDKDAAQDSQTGADSTSDTEDITSTVLTDDELTEWENYFNTADNNGLLRFPYAGLDEDMNQLAPYLSLLFYDIGESDLSDEERTMLEQAGVMMETDTFRLTRDFINSYLYEHFNIPADKTENLIDAANLGTYLIWYDAWYEVHGDCAYSAYTFDRGATFGDGTVRLYYMNNFLSVAQEDGEMDYITAEMIVTLKQVDGRWCVTAHEINGSTRNEQ